MDRYSARELETRYVRWPWNGREETVSMPRWHWCYFDALARRDGMTVERLHRTISEAYPKALTIRSAIVTYVSRVAEADAKETGKQANDNDPSHPLALRLPFRTREEDVAFRTRPKRAPLLPLVKWSPFKPIARAKPLFPEREARHPE
jgi:predicted DNA-binding ribbon-helix-helix protein